MPYYPGLTPVSELRADATLPAAGAYTTPVELPCVGETAITFYIGYTRGGAGGSVGIVVDVSPYATDAGALGTLVWGRLSTKQFAVFAAGADTASGIQREGIITYTSTGATQEVFALTVEPLRTAERIRISVAEIGAVGTPGDCEIIAYQEREP